jgi:hypothetical protein
MTNITSVPTQFVPRPGSDNVIALFDPSRLRRERVPTERSHRSEFDPLTRVTMLCDEVRASLPERFRVYPVARAETAMPTPIFDPITMRLREIDLTIERLEAAVRAQAVS